MSDFRDESSSVDIAVVLAIFLSIAIPLALLVLLGLAISTI